MHNPLLIVGPSGSGKTFIANYLVEKYPFKLVLSSMTRAPREGEKNMVDNEFLTIEEYAEVEKSGDFFMSVEFFGNKYGYRKSFVEGIIAEGKIPIAIVYAPVLKLFLKEYPESHVIFLYPANNDLLIERMKRRGESEETIQKRLEGSKKEIGEYEANKGLYKKAYTITDDTNAFRIIDEILKEYSV